MFVLAKIKRYLLLLSVLNFYYLSYPNGYWGVMPFYCSWFKSSLTITLKAIKNGLLLTARDTIFHKKRPFLYKIQQFFVILLSREKSLSTTSMGPLVFNNSRWGGTCKFKRVFFFRGVRSLVFQCLTLPCGPLTFVLSAIK